MHILIKFNGNNTEYNTQYKMHILIKFNGNNTEYNTPPPPPPTHTDTDTDTHTHTHTHTENKRPYCMPLLVRTGIGTLILTL
jgi:hypothetical protein